MRVSTPLLVVLLLAGAAAAGWWAISGSESRGANARSTSDGADETSHPEETTTPSRSPVPGAPTEPPPLAGNEEIRPERPPPAQPEALGEFAGPPSEIRLARALPEQPVLAGADLVAALAGHAKIRLAWKSAADRAVFLGSRISLVGFVTRAPPVEFLLPEEIVGAARAAGFDAWWAPPVLWIAGPAR